VERLADSFAEPFSEGIASDKKMETEPSRKEDHDDQDWNEDKKAKAFHANEIKNCINGLIFVAGRRFPRLFGDLGAIASGVVRSLSRRFPQYARSRKVRRAYPAAIRRALQGRLRRRAL
jgi:hypothetical protein